MNHGHANGRANSGSSQNGGTCRSGHLDQTDNSVLSEMGSNLALNPCELDLLPDCTDDDCVPHVPLLLVVECLAEVYLRVVSVMVSLAASVDAQPSNRSTWSGTCVYENGNDPHPHGHARENESERAKGVEDGSHRERSVRGDVPPKILRSKEEGCVGANEDANGYPASANESGGVRPNASENAISRLKNENVNG